MRNAKTASKARARAVFSRMSVQASGTWILLDRLLARAGAQPRFGDTDDLHAHRSAARHPQPSRGERSLGGQGSGKDETVPLLDLTREGSRLTWALRITRPMRFNLRFDVTVDADQMTARRRRDGFPRGRAFT